MYGVGNVALKLSIDNANDLVIPLLPSSLGYVDLSKFLTAAN